MIGISISRLSRTRVHFTDLRNMKKNRAIRRNKMDIFGGGGAFAGLLGSSVVRLDLARTEGRGKHSLQTTSSVVLVLDAFFCRISRYLPLRNMERGRNDKHRGQPTHVSKIPFFFGCRNISKCFAHEHFEAYPYHHSCMCDPLTAPVESTPTPVR